MKLFKKELGVSEDVEPAEEVRTEVQSVDEQEVTADDDSPEVKNIRHLVQVLTDSQKNCMCIKLKYHIKPNKHPLFFSKNVYVNLHEFFYASLDDLGL